MKTIKLVILAVVLLGLQACTTPDVVLRQRSQAMHQTVHQEYLKYVENDDSLLPEQKTIRINKIKSYGAVLYESTK